MPQAHEGARAQLPGKRRRPRPRVGCLKETIYSTTKSKIGGLLIKDALSKFKDELSADKYGGAQLLGCKGVCLIGHGSSNAQAICSGVLATADAIRQDMPGRLAFALADGDAQAEGL